MSGSTASLLGTKKTDTLATAKLSAYTPATEWPATTGTSRTSPALTTSAVTITARLLTRSITTPANAPKST